MAVYLPSIDCGTPCSAPDPCHCIPVITESHFEATLGVYGSWQVIATHSPTEYVIYNPATPLPPGLTINETTGLITGTPSDCGYDGSFAANVRVTNICGTQYGVFYFTVSAAAPTLACDTIAANKSKCGFPEYAGHASTPPKYYLTKTMTGGFTYTLTEDAGTCLGACNQVLVSNWTGGTPATANPTTCATSDGSLTETFYFPCGTQYSQTTGYSSSVGDFGIGTVTESLTATTRTVTANAECVGSGPLSGKETGSATETLSDEFTTALLKSETVAALPSYPGTWTGTCEAVADLSSDESDYAIQRFKYKFILPSLPAGAYYKITWNEGSTPKSYVWNGTDTETTPIEVTEPASNGTIGISAIVASGHA